MCHMSSVRPACRYGCSQNGRLLACALLLMKSPINLPPIVRTSPLRRLHSGLIPFRRLLGEDGPRPLLKGPRLGGAATSGGGGARELPRRVGGRVGQAGVSAPRAHRPRLPDWRGATDAGRACGGGALGGGGGVCEGVVRPRLLEFVNPAVGTRAFQMALVALLCGLRSGFGLGLGACCAPVWVTGV